MDIAITANPGMQIELSDGEPDGRRLGVLLSEGTLTDYSHSRNSPGRETESHIEIPLIVCEPEIAPQFNEEQQSIGGGGRTLTVPTTSSEIVNVAPDISIALNLDLDGKGQFGPIPAEVVLEKSSDVVEHSSSRKGKRKMIDQEGNSHVPAVDEVFKRIRMTVVEEDDSDIEYIGSWRPRNTIKTPVKMENVPIKLENLVSGSNVSVKSY